MQLCPHLHINWPMRTQEVCGSFVWKLINQRLEGRHSSLYKPADCVSQVCKLSCNPWVVLLNKISPVPHPKSGTWCWIVTATFGWQKTGKRSKELKLGPYFMQCGEHLQRNYSAPGILLPPGILPMTSATLWALPYLGFTNFCQSSFSCFLCLYLCFPHILADFHCVTRHE